MSSEELKQQNIMADSLIAKLKRIKKLYEEIPCSHELEEMGKQVGFIGYTLYTILQTVKDDDFPAEGCFDDLIKETAMLKDNLEEVSDNDEPF
jgi:hypothetical protein